MMPLMSAEGGNVIRREFRAGLSQRRFLFITFPPVGSKAVRRVMKLNIKLRDGFDHDNVSIKVDGRDVYKKSGVTSDPTISFADSADVETDNEEVKLEVTVEGETKSKTINTRATPFIEVWRTQDNFELRESANEVPMM
jgi:hypothetical protein